MDLETATLNVAVPRFVAGGTCIQCTTAIAGATCADFVKSGTPRTIQQGFGLSAIIGAPFRDTSELIEFGIIDFQPEIKKEPLHFVSMGSGQPVADPFLAFVNRVLWKNNSPTVADGLIGIYWVLSHTCDLAPSGVGKPIRLAVLKRSQGQWGASILDEPDMQQAQHVAAIEQRIGESPKDVISSAAATAPPTPPPAQDPPAQP